MLVSARVDSSTHPREMSCLPSHLPQVENELVAAWAQAGVGVAAMESSDYKAAVSHLEGALRSYRDVDADYGVALVFTFLGMVELIRGKEGEATAMFEKGLSLARRIGDSNSADNALYNLAQISLSHGDPACAATLFEEAVIISEQVRDRAALAYCLEGLAVVANARGEAERCARLIGAAEGLHEAVGIPVYVYYEPHRSPYRARWPPYAPKWVRRPSKQREPMGVR
ncbi:MAG TPA: tetratricopeptide repeat protein [Rubrobacter sp.]|nr:tetratricopeptide repeat protein [Rubrobacter sp.]